MEKSFIYEAQELIHLLKKGSSILFPTDTLPALASLPENASDLWLIKNRPKNNILSRLMDS